VGPAGLGLAAIPSFHAGTLALSFSVYKKFQLVIIYSFI
jgi:hypothetical protein